MREKYKLLEIEFQRIKLGEGDVLVIGIPGGKYSPEEVDQIFELMRSTFPDNQVVITEKGVEFKAVCT